MWIVVGVLLGVVLLSSLLGFHVGPHAHVVSAAVGVGAAVFLVVLAATGHASATLWTLFGADLAVSTGVGVLGWKGLTSAGTTPWGHGVTGLVGREAIVVTDLDPDGVVRIRGENWSATSLNGTVPTGKTVEVLRVAGVRLSVWSDEAEPDDQARSALDAALDSDSSSEERKAGSL